MGRFRAIKRCYFGNLCFKTMWACAHSLPDGHTLCVCVFVWRKKPYKKMKSQLAFSTEAKQNVTRGTHQRKLATTEITKAQAILLLKWWLWLYPLHFIVVDTHCALKKHKALLNVWLLWVISFLFLFLDCGPTSNSIENGGVNRKRDLLWAFNRSNAAIDGIKLTKFTYKPVNISNLFISHFRFTIFFGFW